MKKVLKKAGSVFLAAALSSSVAAVSVTTVSAFESLPVGFNKNDLAEHTMGIVGEFNRWSEDIAKMTDDDGDGVYVGVVEDVEPGEYEFKVRLDGEWDYSWGACEDDTFNSQTNCWINVNTVSDIVVVMDTNGEDGNMWPVNYFALSDEGGDSSVFNASEHTFGVIGSFNDWNEDVEMTEISDGIYCANIGDVEANKDFLIRADGEWDWSWGAYEAEEDRTINSQTNICVPEVAKNVTVFFNTNGSDYHLWQLSFFYTAPDESVKYVNAGKTDGTTLPDESSEPEDDYELYFNCFYDEIIIENFYYYGDELDFVIPNKIDGMAVTGIADGAFSGCTGLTSVTIPDSVTSIGDGAFSGCTGLTSINVDNNNEDYTSENGVLFSKDKSVLVAYPGGKKGAYIIPDSVTEMYWGAFYGCTGLTNVTIPDSVMYIEENTFARCTELTNVTIHDGVTWLGHNAFFGCTGLTSVTIPDSVTTIVNDAFQDCTGLKSVAIGKGVKVIGYGAFSGCTGLTSVDIPNNVEVVGYPVYVDNSGSGYFGVFEDCTGLTNVNIPESVTKIDLYTFKGCTGLTSVSIPNSVTYIGDEAFFGCTGLTNIIIPDSVTYIGSYAFEDCTGLTSVTIPDSVTEIDDNAFYGCTDLIIFGKVGSAAEKYANENNIPFIALDNELTDTETNITVTVDIGENIKLEVSELKPEDLQISGKKICAYYDISLTENGVKVQPDGNVTVKIPYKGDSENIEVYRINDDGTTEKMQSSYDGEYVTFITDHFSKYAIVTDGGIEGDTNNDGEVNIADALMISRYDAGMAELDGSQLSVSDVNGDGEVNIADALMISRFDAGLIDKL